MISRALIIDAATGRILRTLTAPPEMIALNVRAGEAAFLITDDNGGCINDNYVVLSDAGEMVLTEDAPEGATAPAYEIQYVAV